MYASELPAGFEAGESMIGFTQLYRMFSTSAPGKALSGKTRFLTFKPDAVPEAEWRNAMGVEADRLAHGLEAWKLSKKYLALAMESGHEFSEDDLVSIQLACLIHDWAGTERDDLMEPVPSLSPDTPETIRSLLSSVASDKALQARLERVIDSVLLDPSSVAYNAFLTVEALGYGDILLWAWKKGSAVKGSFQEDLRYFALRLFISLMPVLGPRSAQPPVKAWMEKHAEPLEQIARLSDADVIYFPPDGFDRSKHPKGFLARFETARDAWDARGQ